eukprot:Em0001g532a
MLQRLRFGKRKGGDGDSVSNYSAASAKTRDDGVTGVYEIARVKDLPKLHRAAWKGKLAKLKDRTKGINKKNLNSQEKLGNRSALHLGCARGHLDVVHHLCSLTDIDVNLIDSDGCTPLHRAVQSGQGGCVQTLIQRGANTRVQDKQGHTPLHLVAMCSGDVKIATSLLEAGADIEAIDKDGSTALHLAVVTNHSDLVTSLIADGAHVDAVDGKGRTPLILAAIGGRPTILKPLIANKADPDIKCHDGYTALDYALKQNHADCSRLIKDHEEAVAKEKIRNVQHRRQSSLVVDPKLINAFYGTPAKNHDDDPPSKTEDSHSHLAANDQNWNSDTGEEDDHDHADDKPESGGKMNLKAAMERSKLSSGVRRELQLDQGASASKSSPPGTLNTSLAGLQSASSEVSAGVTGGKTPQQLSSHSQPNKGTKPTVEGSPEHDSVAKGTKPTTKGLQQDSVAKGTHLAGEEAGHEGVGEGFDSDEDDPLAMAVDQGNKKLGRVGEGGEGTTMAPPGELPRPPVAPAKKGAQLAPGMVQTSTQTTHRQRQLLLPGPSTAQPSSDMEESLSDEASVSILDDDLPIPR